MTDDYLSMSASDARRLAIAKQHLGGRTRGEVSQESILSVIRDLGCLQLDPINAVAPSHVIVLWSRLGKFRLSDLDSLLWDKRMLFEYWAHQASIVAMDDYPLYYSMMRGYPDSFPKPWGAKWRSAVRRWLAAHTELRRKMLKELERGPLLLGQFEDHAQTRKGSGWGSRSDVSSMLFHLQMSGVVMVVGHEGNQKLWGLAREFLPSWASKENLTEEEVEHAAVQRAILALGVASPAEISSHFLRGRYRNLKATLARLAGESKIRRARVAGMESDERYVHSDDIGLLGSLDSDRREPQLALLSPFDNLICDRGRTRKIFGFEYTSEIYVPASRRRFGYYVLPILWGDRFVGRIDPRFDRRTERLVVNSIHREPGIPEAGEVPRRLKDKVEELADFLGARGIEYSRIVPAALRSALH